MALATSEQEIQEETKCPICLEYFTHPVSVECGHNFCHGCITQYCEAWEEQSREPLSCPKCRARIRKENLRSNWDLANVTEKIKQLVLTPGKENLCERHQEKLNLFCEEEGKAICVVCERSSEHRSHTVVLMEEAVKKYKQQIQTQLQILKEKREKLLRFKLTEDKEIQQYLEKTQTERQKIESKFQQLHQFLEEQKRLLLAGLVRLDKEILKFQDENITKLTKEISCLSELISEMEGKCQQAASEFLQDVQSTLSRYEKRQFQNPVGPSAELKCRVWEFSQTNTILQNNMKKFKEMLSSELKLSKANVTLDPDTPHPQLILCENRKSVRLGRKLQNLPENPKRFDSEPCVLGCEGFTSGRHHWEVEVEDGREWQSSWAVGIAQESIRRKGEIKFNPEGGIWAVGVRWNTYRALTSPEVHLSLSEIPRRIRVYLDYEWGQVAFFNADNEAPIFTFPPTSFTGERLFPFFWVWDEKSKIKLYP